MLRHALLFFLFSLTSLASVPEEPRYLSDLAELLPPVKEEQLRSTLSEYHNNTGKEVKVITIAAISDYPSLPQQFESFATRLFNTWGIGDPALNDGVLMLVSKGDRKVRIEVGSGYDRSMDYSMQSVISESIVPEFKKGNFDEGIIDGVAGIFLALKNDAAKKSPPTPVEFVPTESSPALPAGESQPAKKLPASEPSKTSQPNDSIILGWLTGIIGTIAATLFGLWRKHRNKCPHCKIKMTLLCEATEDAHLTEKQQFEERIGSLNYDVLDCPSCDHIEVHRRRKFFSGFTQCPSCSTKALKSRTEILKRATTYSTGKKRVHSSCSFCDHKFYVDRIIPKKADHSSSSSSGFSSGGGGGGGSSSGGGASGGW